MKGEEPTLNYGEIIDELEKKHINNKKIGSIAETYNELENIKKELELKYGEDWRNKDIGFMDAIDDKRSAGSTAVFNHDTLKKVVGPSEKVWNDFYSLLRKATEENAPKEFADVNKAISDLIPIELAYKRRVRQLDKNNMFGLYDYIGGLGAFTAHPTAIAIPLIHRAMKSPTVANIS